jgi:hypothetical protein
MGFEKSIGSLTEKRSAVYSGVMVNREHSLAFRKPITSEGSSIQREVGFEYTVLGGGRSGVYSDAQDVGRSRRGQPYVLNRKQAM